MNFLDGNGLLYVWQKIRTYISTLLQGKVDKVEGKGLSANDLTNELKNTYDNAVKKVDDLTASGGEPNIIETVKVNGAIQEVINKSVDISVPTKISQLVNDDNTVKDAGYVHTDNNYTTSEKNKLAGLENYDDTEIKQQIAKAGKIDNIKVNGVPQTVVDKSVDLQIPTDNKDLANGAGYLTQINSNQVTGALGFTPYNSTNPNNYQTLEQVNSIVEGVIGAAPEALDTLEELAKALGENENFAATITEELGKKVDTEDITSITNEEIDSIIV